MSTAARKTDKGRGETDKGRVETNDEEGPDMEMKRDDHYQAVIELFFPYLLDKLRASHLLCLIHLDEVSRVKYKIQRMENDGDYKGAAEELLEAIKRSTEPGRWQMFVDAAREDGDESLVDLLVEGKVGEEWWQEHRFMIEAFAPLLDDINIAKMLSKLFQAKLISRDDFGKLEAKLKKGDRKGAVGEMLVFIQRCKVNNWFKTFLAILVDCDHSELAKAIGEDKCVTVSEEREAPDATEATSQSRLTPVSQGASSAQQSGGRCWPSLTRPPGPSGEPGQEHGTASQQEPPSCSCACCARVMTELSALGQEMTQNRQEMTQVRQEMTQVSASLKAEREQTAALRAEKADLKKILLKLGNRH